MKNQMTPGLRGISLRARRTLRRAVKQFAGLEPLESRSLMTAGIHFDVTLNGPAHGPFLDFIGMTADVTPLSGVTAPSQGTVSFFEGSVQIGSAVIDDTGHAALSFIPSGAGIHAYSATFSGGGSTQDTALSQSGRQFYNPGPGNYGYQGPNGDLVIAVGDANQLFVSELYNALLSRSPDNQGVSDWSSKLDAGASRESVVAGFLGSHEYHTLVVQNDYATLLDRQGSAGEVEQWADKMDMGQTPEQVEAQFLGSNEFYGSGISADGPTPAHFIDEVYLKLLGRSADNQGLTAWTNELTTLANPTSGGRGSAPISPDPVTIRTQVASQIMLSDENLTKTVAGFYTTYLHRQQGGEGHEWVDVLKQEQQTQLLTQFLSSDEFYIGLDAGGHYLYVPTDLPQPVFATPAYGPPATPPGTTTDPNVLQVADANNQFFAKLYAQLKTDEGNLFFSPFSIDSALSMTANGAAGNTAGQMDSVLGIDGSIDAYNQGYSTLMAALNGTGDQRPFDLSVANALWAADGKTFLQGYVDLMTQKYGAGFANLDFADQAEASRTTINDWVADKTNGKIQDLLPEGFIQPTTQLVLTNAIYFKGTWATAFDAVQTNQQQFQTLAGGVVNTDMMHMTNDMSYYSDPNVQAVQLDYTGGLAMLVMLPTATGATPAQSLTNFEDGMTANYIDHIRENLQTQDVQLSLPKWQETQSTDLTQVLQDMGMSDAFSNNADFSGMDGVADLKISQVVHKAFVDVNEQGTEAAGATGVGISILAVMSPPAPPILFNADHPFVYLIVDKSSGAILFGGRVGDPTQTA